MILVPDKKIHICVMTWYYFFFLMKLKQKYNMKKAGFYTISTLLTLFFISESNYFLNQSVYDFDFSLFNILVANVSLVCSCVFLAAAIKKTNSFIGTIFITLFFFVLLFITASEFLIFKYSGVAFEEQSFLHFEPHALWVGFTIHPILYTLVVTVLVLISFLFVRVSLNVAINKRNFMFFLIFVFSFLLNAYGSAVGRLIINYNEFIASQNLETLSATDIEPLKPFGIQAIKTDADIFSASLTKKKKNLIVIYLESFSRGFVNSERYPELTPNINELIKKHGELTDYHSTAKFTMQGMISSMCGLAPKLQVKNNISTDSLPYKNLPCLPNILHRLGYQQEFIGGARKSFSNKAAFFKSKQFDAVYGWLDYKKPKEYLTNDWGLQDHDLFDFALNKITSLHDSPQPFHVSMLTLATHLNGNPDPKCPKYSKDATQHKFIEGIHCTDYLLGKFINDLDAIGILEDTTVMITSDHGVFPVKLIKDLFGSNFKRNQLVGILIDDYEFDTTLPFGLYDLPAIVLRALGVDTDVSFINGRFPEEVTPDRFILRESVLNENLNKNADCNSANEINFPVDYCENERLIDSSWRYAANFNQQINPLNLNNGINVKTTVKGKRYRVELTLDGQDQSALFLSEGYPVTDAHRKYRNHIFILVYDVKNQTVESRNAFRFLSTHVDYFYGLMTKPTNDEKLYFIFTEQGVEAVQDPAWQMAFNSIGSQGFNYPDKAYFAVLRKKGDASEMAEFISEKDKGIQLIFKKLKNIPLKPIKQPVNNN